MKKLAVMLTLVLLAVLLPADVYAWTPSDPFGLGNYAIRYPSDWLTFDNTWPFQLAVGNVDPAIPEEYVYMVGDVSTKEKYSAFLILAQQMGATDLQVLDNIGFVTVQQPGLKVKEAKIGFVYEGSTYYATVLSSNYKNEYLSCMVVFPWQYYQQASAQEIFNTLSSTISHGKKR